MKCGFEGMSLSWYFVVLPGYIGNATTGTWSIDDNPGQNFTINGYGVNDAGVSNQILFNTSRYAIGPHRLNVTYNGDSTTTPLAMGFMVIQNSSIDGSTPPTSSTGSSMAAGLTSSASAIPTSINPTSSSPDIGASIGGAVGGVVVLAIAVFLFMFYRRRRQSRNEWNKPSTSTAAPEYHTQPFVLSPQSAWREPVSTVHSHTDGWYSNSSPHLVNQLGGKARTVNNSVDLGSDSEGSSQRGAMPPSKRAAKRAGVALGQGERIHRDPQEPLDDGHAAADDPAATNPSEPEVVVCQDSGIRLPEPQAPARRVLEMPPEYTLD